MCSLDRRMGTSKCVVVGFRVWNGAFLPDQDSCGTVFMGAVEARLEGSKYEQEIRVVHGVDCIQEDRMERGCRHSNRKT
jgi:hypothetical protein